MPPPRSSPVLPAARVGEQFGDLGSFCPVANGVRGRRTKSVGHTTMPLSNAGAWREGAELRRRASKLGARCCVPKRVFGMVNFGIRAGRSCLRIGHLELRPTDSVLRIEDQEIRMGISEFRINFPHVRIAAPVFRSDHFGLRIGLHTLRIRFYVFRAGLFEFRIEILR